jgi:hypothetical protein
MDIEGPPDVLCKVTRMRNQKDVLNEGASLSQPTIVARILADSSVVMSSKFALDTERQSNDQARVDATRVESGLCRIQIVGRQAHGLLSGQALPIDLNRMEMAITRIKSAMMRSGAHFSISLSLHQFNPAALLKMKATVQS